MTDLKTAVTDPQSVNGEEVVLWFDDLGSGNEEYNFLSNFYQGAPITLDGVTWEAAYAGSGLTCPEGLTGPVEFLTGEHAFAAMKFFGSDVLHFGAIVEARDTWIPEGNGKDFYLSAPNHAKSLGRSRSHPIREDWEEKKLDVMCAVTRAKYAPGRVETTRLLSTGDALLVEGTYWGDEVWGVDLNAKSCWLPGRNWLGTILMARRAEMRAYEKSLSLNEVVNTVVMNTGFYNSEFAVTQG